MIGHGDELGRTQRGNNNGYCQDSEITWVDWESVDESLLAFVRDLTALRRDHPVFRRRRFFDGRPVRRVAGTPIMDIAWFTPDGVEMSEEAWGVPFGKCIAVFLNGDGIPDTDPRGERISDDSFLLCFNGHHEPVDFTTPPGEYAEKWQVVLDTADGTDPDRSPASNAGDRITVHARSLLVLIKAV
jgi:glycogen operon protein